MIIASLIILGRAGLDSGQDCQFLISNTSTFYVYGNNFTDYHWDDYDGASVAPLQVDRDAFLFHTEISNEYEYVCENVVNSNYIWIYKLPLWLAYLSSLYLIIYLLIYVWDLIKELPFFRRGRRG
jgi:hypothetical protein